MSTAVLNACGYAALASDWEIRKLMALGLEWRAELLRWSPLALAVVALVVGSRKKRSREPFLFLCSGEVRGLETGYSSARKALA